MKFVGQTSIFLKTRFTDHYRRMTKPCKIDNFLYRHFKLTYDSPNHISTLKNVKAQKVITMNWCRLNSALELT